MEDWVRDFLSMNAEKQAGNRSKRSFQHTSHTAFPQSANDGPAVYITQSLDCLFHVLASPPSHWLCLAALLLACRWDRSVIGPIPHTDIASGSCSEYPYCQSRLHPASPILRACQKGEKTHGRPRLPQSFLGAPSAAAHPSLRPLPIDFQEQQDE